MVPRSLPLLLSALLLGAAPGRAQELRVEGEVRHPAVEALREVTGRGEYSVQHRDTLLPADTRIPGDLVVVDADVRLEGRVEGSVLVLPGGEREGEGPAPRRRHPAIARKLRRMSLPPDVSTDSGWNCTPHTGCVRCRRAWISESSCSAVATTRSSSGSDERSTVRE